jgi:hypothetical protein
MKVTSPCKTGVDQSVLHFVLFFNSLVNIP